jgi:hypothetical protein
MPTRASTGHRLPYFVMILHLFFFCRKEEEKREQKAKLTFEIVRIFLKENINHFKPSKSICDITYSEASNYD